LFKDKDIPELKEGVEGCRNDVIWDDISLRKNECTLTRLKVFARFQLKQALPPGLPNLLKAETECGQF